MFAVSFATVVSLRNLLSIPRAALEQQTQHEELVLGVLVSARFNQMPQPTVVTLQVLIGSFRLVVSMAEMFQ